MYLSHELIRAIGTQRSGEITRGLEYFLSTGNLISKGGLALQQNNGFSVFAERINQLRFVSHFRYVFLFGHSAYSILDKSVFFLN